MSHRRERIEWILVSIAVLVIMAFFFGNSALATNADNLQCAPRTAIAKGVILASLSDADKNESSTHVS